MQSAARPLWSSSLGERDLSFLEQGYYTVPAVAARLHCSERYAYDLFRTGQLPGQKVAGKWIAPETAVVRILAGDQA